MIFIQKIFKIKEKDNNSLYKKNNYKMNNKFKDYFKSQINK